MRSVPYPRHLSPGPLLGFVSPTAVSYTHLDVYKRQWKYHSQRGCGWYFSVLQKCFLSFGTTERSGLYKSGLSLKYR